MTTTLKYNLKQITDISNELKFEIPDDTFDIINYLCSQVGSVNIASKTFIKTPATTTSSSDKKKRNKNMEVSAEEWETIRTFQTKKVEPKSAVDSTIDELRLYLNKLTEKTFLDTREKILCKIDSICGNPVTDLTAIIDLDKTKIGNILYDICSTNQFYSNIFADLFVELALKYDWLNNIFKNHYNNIMDEYKNIQYIDSDKDYDGFCDMNKKNERRRSITTFYVNLAINGFIKKSKIIQMLNELLGNVLELIRVANKKNEVDELTEIIAILYNKTLIEKNNNKFVIDEVDDTSGNEDSGNQGDEDYEDITDKIEWLAQQKAKDYLSLSNKSVFKYMDLVEM